jgi:hypothetical protein
MTNSFSISQGHNTPAISDGRVPTVLWVMWDIHAEPTRGWDLPVGDIRPASHLAIVTGDLIPRMERGARCLAKLITDRQALYVTGNHELYGGRIRTVERRAARSRPPPLPSCRTTHFEQVHVVDRIFGGVPVASGRRYDRLTDSFIYVGPGSMQSEGE